MGFSPDHADDWADSDTYRGKSGLKPVISRCLYPGLKSGVIQDVCTLEARVIKVPERLLTRVLI